MAAAYPEGDPEPTEHRGGYPREIFVKLDENILCPICKLVFRDPMQRECGHRFCEDCLDTPEAKEFCNNCFDDTTDASFPPVSLLNNEVKCSPDFFLRKEIDRLPAKCMNTKCNWEGKFKDYKQHCLICDWRPVVCNMCHAEDIPSSMLEKHQEDCGKMESRPDLDNEIPTTMQDLPEVCNQLSKFKIDVAKILNSSEQKMDKLDKIVGVIQNDMLKYTKLYINGVKEREALSIKINKNTPEVYNGIYVWRVDDFEKRRQEAVDGTCTSIYSLPFYTDHFGYKMCLRLYLNGDGIGKGKAISLFIVVMQGQFDAVLSWPFKQKVTLMMLDQLESNHVVDTFRPDSKSSSFQRPEQKMNIASGCPLFFPIERINTPNNYFRNNTAFFKVIVDRNGLEKMSVNFAPN